MSKILDKAKELLGRAQSAGDDDSMIHKSLQTPKPFSISGVPNKVPKILITFNNLQFPEFEFQDWSAGVSLGSVERAGQLMIREAQIEQAKFLQKLRIDESKAQTQQAEAALTS